MAIEKTLAIIKPDALEKGIIGEVCKRVEDGGLKIVGIKMMQLSPKKAEGFYAVHQGKPFFASLVKYMTSGPVVVLCLEGEHYSSYRLLRGTPKSSQARFTPTCGPRSSAMISAPGSRKTASRCSQKKSPGSWRSGPTASATS